MVWNHQELKELEKYTSYDLAQKLRGVLEKQARGDQILIGNTGMVSSGKSSLFNALLGAVEEERFKTGAIPTTRRATRRSSRRPSVWSIRRALMWMRRTMRQPIKT